MTMTNAGSEDQKKIAAIVAFVLIAAAIFYFEYFYTSSPATPEPVASVPVAPPRATAAAPVIVGGKAARSLGTTSAALDPSLRMDAMLVSESVEYAGIGRNIFSPNSAPPVVIPQPIGPARLQAKASPAPPPIPCPPNCPPPPPPPPIDLKFFGTVETGASGVRKALLLHGEDVFVASAGEIVMRRYRIVKVDPKTIEVEDMQTNNKQTLPLLSN
jgi:hypothetical protein